MWAWACRNTSSPRPVSARTAAWLHCVPDGAVQRLVLAQQLRGEPLQPQHRGVVAQHVVADLGASHRRAHLLGRPRDGVAAQVDGLHGGLLEGTCRCRTSVSQAKAGAEPAPGPARGASGTSAGDAAAPRATARPRLAGRRRAAARARSTGRRARGRRRAERRATAARAPSRCRAGPRPPARAGNPRASAGRTRRPPRRPTARRRSRSRWAACRGSRPRCGRGSAAARWGCPWR